jgi:hypothetical protein
MGVHSAHLVRSLCVHAQAHTCVLAIPTKKGEVGLLFRFVPTVVLLLRFSSAAIPGHSQAP